MSVCECTGLLSLSVLVAGRKIGHLLRTVISQQVPTRFQAFVEQKSELGTVWMVLHFLQLSRHMASHSFHLPQFASIFLPDHVTKDTG